MLDYGSGNLRSAQRALERVGADVTVTDDAQTAIEADGLAVPSVGTSPGEGEVDSLADSLGDSLASAPEASRPA